jgi:hypothetical protein
MAPRSKKDPAPHVGIPLGPHIEEYLVPPTFDDDGVQATAGIGPDGREVLDPTPMSVPLGYEPPSDLNVMLEQLFRRGQAVLQAAQVETEEEANDFNCEDDPFDELTEYEKVFMPPPAPVAPAAAAANTPGASPDPGSTQTVVGHSTGTPAVAAASPSGSSAPAQAP